MTSLFQVPISTGGSFDCTSPAKGVYLLSFESPPDNRLTTPFIQAFLTSLDKIEINYPTGVVITTSKITKFYSNGLDLDHVRTTKEFHDDSFFPLFRRLLTYPMPTIALLNGHAFAGGLILAMYHDYRVQNPSKGYLCLNEIHFGAVLDAPLMSVFREKVPSPQTFRALVLEGRRFTAQTALAAGLVDALGGLEETLKLVKEGGLTEVGKMGTYGAMKEEMYRHSLGFLHSYKENLKWRKWVEGEKGAEKLKLGRAGEMAAAKAKAKI